VFISLPFHTHRKKDIDETLKMPRGIITDVQLQQFTNHMRIPRILEASLCVGDAGVKSNWDKLKHSL